MGKIIVLPDEVSSKIAAGEVIEGPFSVVRELLDNALDAGASRVSVAVDEGGKNRIEVSDDGDGMSAEDAALALRKHTTSKISDISDLDTLGTLGFRGEALSSICTVSDLELVTRRKEDETGVRVRCSFGRDLGAVPSASNAGTVMTVRSLFRNLPARKKFLKSDRAEYLLVKDEIVRKALGHHETGFAFSADGRVVFSLISRNSLPERIEELFGRQLAESLVEAAYDEEQFSIRMLISNRSQTLANRRGQYFFVNRRPVFARSFSYALNNPSRGIVPAGRFVYAFVSIQVPGSLVDVNVHPAKKEIKLKGENRIVSALHRLTGDILGEKFYPSYSPGRFGEAVTVNEPGAGPSPGAPDSGTGNTGDLWPSPGMEAAEALPETAPAAPASETGSPSPIRYRGVVFQTYLLFEGPDYLLLVDQHAAHERVLYERLRAGAAGGALKSLLIPINFTPPRRSYADVLDNLERFREAGIVMEPFGEESFNIVALSGAIPEHSEGEVVSQLLDEFCDGKIDLGTDELSERLLRISSCRNAVKEGDVLRPDEALELLRSLQETKVPHVCPHGRPTVLRLTRRYFTKAFKRG